MKAVLVILTTIVAMAVAAPTAVEPRKVDTEDIERRQFGISCGPCQNGKRSCYSCNGQFGCGGHFTQNC